MNKGKVISLDLFGQGIIKVDGKCIFLRNALPGETVDYEITEAKRNFSYGAAKKVLAASSSRREPPCPYYGCCGGCCFQHMDYALEMKAKEEHLRNILERVGGIKTEGVLEEMDHVGAIYGYRNKVTWQIKNGKFGFYQKNSKEFLPIEKCLLLETPLQRATELLSEMDLNDGEQLSLRCNFNGEISAFYHGYLTEAQALEMRKAVPGLISIAAPEKNFDNNYFIMTLGEFRYRLEGNSFFQVNTMAAKSMLDHSAALIKRELDAANNGILLDLYCGVGTFGIYLGDMFEKVVGIEAFVPAVADAGYNAELNGIKGEYIAAKTEASLFDLLASMGRPQVVVVDPPRAGLAKDSVNALLASESPLLLYISCDPGTLSRDLKLLSAHYQPCSIKPFNLFPRTGHVECIVLLSKVQN
ncbi:MAG: class I SAM-dependent RNA methyltransferase [Bacillota bacterium]|nr:class I SAM-dependent RNA methyltransferase [Bacillota bacterium]